MQALRDKLLFELYGGKAVTDELLIVEDDNQNTGDAAQDQSGQTDSYAIEAFVIARQHLQVVDNWAGQANQAKLVSDESVLVNLQRDGRLLKEAFNRQAALKGDDETGARLAAEELAIRLKYFA